MPPVEPGKNAIGTNTATSTSVMPMIAEVICVIAFTVASYGDRPSSVMMRSTFSTTTIASSTRMPIASTMPNSVSTLIEKPNSHSPRHAPASAIGTTMVGISVARQFCRNRNMTRNTSAIASTSVLTTSSIEMRMNGVESNGMVQRDVRRERALELRHAALDARRPSPAHWRRSASCTAMPAAGLPLSSMSKE